MTGCMETLCTRCAHLHVCSLKEEFLNAQAAVNRVDVSRDDKSFIPLNQIKWIKPVELLCIHYLKSEEKNTRYNSFDKVATITDELAEKSYLMGEMR